MFKTLRIKKFLSEEIVFNVEKWQSIQIIQEDINKSMEIMECVTCELEWPLSNTVSETGFKPSDMD